MKKLKIVTVVGTRPEVIRLSRVMAKLDRYTEQIIVHTGQNFDYELNKIFFEDLKIREPNYFLNVSGLTSSQTIGNVIIEVEKILIKENPDALLVLGDTYSCMSVLPAKRLKIPIFHMEAGNRCFDLRVPEEIIRKIVDHTADINLPYSDIAREYLIREGLLPEMIIKTGSPLKEVIYFYDKKIKSSKVLRNLNLKKNEFFLVSCHREENLDLEINFKKFNQMLTKLCAIYKLPIIVSTHPRTKKKIDALNIKHDNLIHFMKPFKFSDYMKLQLSAKATLSDSGSITEESSIMNFPALNIRESHERPEGMEQARVMMVGFDIDRICQGLKILENENFKKGFNREVSDYSDENISQKILNIVHSYTNYVNNKIWKKSN